MWRPEVVGKIDFGIFLLSIRGRKLCHFKNFEEFPCCHFRVGPLGAVRKTSLNIEFPYLSFVQCAEKGRLEPESDRSENCCERSQKSRCGNAAIIYATPQQEERSFMYAAAKSTTEMTGARDFPVLAPSTQ